MPWIDNVIAEELKSLEKSKEVYVFLKSRLQYTEFFEALKYMNLMEEQVADRIHREHGANYYGSIYENLFYKKELLLEFDTLGAERYRCEL